MHAFIDYRKEDAPLQFKRRRPFIARAPWVLIDAAEAGNSQQKQRRYWSLDDAARGAQHLGFESATIDGIPLDAVELSYRFPGNERIRVTTPGHSPLNRRVMIECNHIGVLYENIELGRRIFGEAGVDCEVTHNKWPAAQLALTIMRPVRRNDRLEVDYGPRGALCRFGDNGDAFEVQFPLGVPIVARVHPAENTEITEDEMRWIHKRLGEAGFDSVDVEVVTDEPRPEYPYYHLSRTASQPDDADEVEQMENGAAVTGETDTPAETNESAMSTEHSTDDNAPPNEAKPSDTAAETVGAEPVESEAPTPEPDENRSAASGDPEGPLKVREPTFGEKADADASAEEAPKADDEREDDHRPDAENGTTYLPGM